MQIRKKEVKLSLFTDNMIIYVEISKKKKACTRTNSELVYKEY